jgi:hypothetical protein
MLRKSLAFTITARRKIKEVLVMYVPVRDEMYGLARKGGSVMANKLDRLGLSDDAVSTYFYGYVEMFSLIYSGYSENESWLFVYKEAVHKLDSIFEHQKENWRGDVSKDEVTKTFFETLLTYNEFGEICRPEDTILYIESHFGEKNHLSELFRKFAKDIT